MNKKYNQIKHIFFESEILFNGNTKNNILNICKKYEDKLCPEVYFILLKVIDDMYIESY